MPPSPPPNAPTTFPIFLTGFLCGTITLLIVGRINDVSNGGEEMLLRRVHELVGDTFVDELPDDQLVDRALSGLIDGLDDYSRYITGENIAQLDRETTGLYNGIGVLFREPPTPQSGVRQILFPLKGSPAHDAGLQPGDEFVRVDGQTVAEMGPGELQAHFRTHDGDAALVEYVTLDGETRQIELRPRPVIDPSVRHGRVVDRANEIGYFAVTSFSRRTPQEFRDEVDYLVEAGARSLVIDLRGNPGGVLDSAVEIADLFVDTGTIVATRSRTEERTFEAHAEAPYAHHRVVLLIEGTTASASEVLAGALQDHRVAVVVGEPSYGKGVVQTLTRFEDDRAIIKLTTSRYHTPSGRRIDRSSPDPHEHGIAPDLLVPMDDDVRGEVLGHLISYSPPHDAEPLLEAWSERQGESLIDAPPDDPQLDAAVELLAGTLLSAR